MSFHGITMSAPDSWPVYNLADDPTQCVNFAVHAVYLGTPSANQDCPAQATGQTGAVLVEPVSQDATDQAQDALPSGTVDGHRVSLGDPSTSDPDYRMVSPQAHAEVVITDGSDHATPTQISGSIHIGSAAAAAAPIPPAGPTGVPDASVTTTAAIRDSATSAVAGPAIYDGEGFDTCAAPSEAHMSDWSASPYRSVGIYLGGDESACAQPNLTTSWVDAVSDEGWHLIPTWVGPQASCSDASFGSTVPSSTTTAETDGEGSAKNAATAAADLGLGAGSPIYYDMEAYDIGDSACNAAVLAFLDGWTTELHTLGYESGVYSSAASGIVALESEVGSSSYTEPDDVWIADYNDDATEEVPAYVPDGLWYDSQRIHQYEGDIDPTYDGVTISVDADYCDGLLADPGSAPASTESTVPTISTSSRTGPGDVTISGTATPGATVTLYDKDFGATSYAEQKTLTANATTGAYSTVEDISYDNSYYVESGGEKSADATADVTVDVSETLAPGRGTVAATVTTDPPVWGVDVSWERVNSNGTLTDLRTVEITDTDGKLDHTLTIHRSSVTIKAVVTAGDDARGGTSTKKTVTVAQ